MTHFSQKYNFKDSPVLNTLNLFAHGTFQEFNDCSRISFPLTTLGSRPCFITLTPAMVRKLKKLSIVSMCAESKAISPPPLAHSQCLRYGALCSALAIPSVRELEDIIIEAIYDGLILGSFDQKAAAFHV